jgi:hypothetical protein
LAAAGIDIVGLDYDVMMLTVAAQRERRQRSQVREQRPQPTQQAGARFITSDMRRFALHRQFGAVLIPYNSVQLLTDLADQRACLRLAAAHLAEGGVVGVEVTDFQEGATHASVGEEVLHTGWLGDERVTLIGSLTHDFGCRISRYHRRFLSSGWTREDDAAIRSMNKAELSELLATTDLTPRRWWTEGAVTRVVASVSPVLSSSRCRDEHRGPT